MRKIAKAHNFIREHNILIFWSSVATIVLSLILYVWGVNVTVRNVAKRNIIEGELSTLNASIGELEFKYIALTNRVDLSFAKSIGFVETSETRFVSRRSSSVAFVVSSNTQ